MSTNKYPEEIYIYPKGSHPKLFGKVARDTTARAVAEYAYDLGKKHREVPESATWILEALERGNISPAVAIGQACALGKEHAAEEQDTWTLLDHDQPIDYEKLDGREVWLKHEDGDVYGRLKLRNRKKPESHVSWVLHIPCSGDLVSMAWDGSCGWSLYVKGDLPLRKRTAEELEPGMCFKGLWRSAEEPEDMMRVSWANGNPGVIPVGGWGGSYRAHSVEVLEVYGIGFFKKESE